jgi:hypothetical protein
VNLVGTEVGDFRSIIQCHLNYLGD